ncbi:hypothetical protein [Agrobacterium fabrum]|uniref:hypothetical protein n=1 Tax=Agrobacterium fabrum TaxID=1176649 RepID=UPI003B9E4216
MTLVSRLPAVSLTAVSIFSASLAAADDAEKLYNGGRNQLGLIKYCVEQGHSPAQAVTNYQKIIATLPEPKDISFGDRYEKEGVAGNNFDGETSVPMQAIAEGMGISVADRCAQLTALGNQ